MMPLTLFLLGCVMVYVGVVQVAFTALMRLPLRLNAERSERKIRPETLGHYLEDPVRLFVPGRLLQALATIVATMLVMMNASSLGYLGLLIVFAGLVVVAGAVHFAVVLRDVEIDGPRAELVGDCFVGRPEFLVAVIFPEQRVVRRVVAEHERVGVSEVRLESKRFGHAHFLHQRQRGLPGMETGPADFTLSGQALAMVGGDLGGFLERGGDALDIVARILEERRHSELGRVDADHAVLAGTVFVENLGDAAGHLHRVEELGLARGLLHGTAGVHAHCSVRTPCNDKKIRIRK